MDRTLIRLLNLTRHPALPVRVRVYSDCSIDVVAGPVSFSLEMTGEEVKELAEALLICAGDAK